MGKNDPRRKRCVRASGNFDRAEKILHGSKMHFIKFVWVEYVSTQTPQSFKFCE